MYSQVAVSALRDLQQQLATSEQEAAQLRKQVDDAHAETKAVRQDAEQDASQRDIESSQLRQLIMELKDELQQAVREQDHSQECNNSLRRDLTAAHDELSSVKASNATLEDTMALRLTDIRQLEQEKSLAASTIRDLTSRTDTLEQQLAESKDEVRQAESRAAEAYVAREEAQSALRVAQTETRTGKDSLAALQRSSEATKAELNAAQKALEEAKDECKELRESVEKMRQELAAVYARAHRAEVSAASAAAAASAPAAALHTSAEQMKQEVAVVRALALRGVDAEGTLDACEAALVRGFHSISRVAEAYETLKPQLAHSPHSTPSDSKENAHHSSHSAASSVVAVLPFQDASNRKLGAANMSLTVCPDSAAGIRSLNGSPLGHSHSRFSHVLPATSQNRPPSAFAAPVEQAKAHAQQLNACIPQTHEAAAGVAPDAIAAVHAPVPDAAEQVEQPTSAKSCTTLEGCMPDTHSVQAPVHQMATGPPPAESTALLSVPDTDTAVPLTAEAPHQQIPQWFHESFSSAHGPLTSITMPHMHASILSHTPGVTLLAAHTNSNTTTTAGHLQQPSQPSSCVPPEPSSAPSNPQLLVVTNAGSSSRASSSRGASPSPQSLLPHPSSHPLATTQLYNYNVSSSTAVPTVPGTSAINTAFSHQPPPGLVPAHAAVEASSQFGNLASTTLLNVATTDSHTFVPTTAVHTHAESAAHGQYGQQQQIRASFEGQVPEQSTLSTFPYLEVANTAVLPGVTASRDSSHHHQEAHGMHSARSCRAASPSLRNLPEASYHAPAGTLGCAPAALQAHCFPAHACGVLQAPSCVPGASAPQDHPQGAQPHHICSTSAVDGTMQNGWHSNAAQRTSSPAPSRPVEQVADCQHRMHCTQHASVLATAAAGAAEAQQHATDGSAHACRPHDTTANDTTGCNAQVWRQQPGEVPNQPQRSAHPPAATSIHSMHSHHHSSYQQQQHCPSRNDDISSPEKQSPQPHCPSHTSRQMHATVPAAPSEDFSDMHDRNAGSPQQSWHMMHAESSQENVDLQPQRSPPGHSVHMESSSLQSVNEGQNEEWLEESSADRLAEESSASLAGYYNGMDMSCPLPVHQEDSSTTTIVPFSGSSRPPGHLQTSASAARRARQHAATKPMLSTSQPPPHTTPGQPRRHQSSKPSVPVSTKTPSTASTQSTTPRSASQRTSTPKTVPIPIRSTRASRGHSKQPVGISITANRFTPVATVRPDACTRGRRSTGRASTPKTSSSTIPVQTARPRRSVDHSPEVACEMPSERDLAERMAHLRRNLSRQDLQHDAVLRQIAASRDSRERHKLKADLKTVRETMIHTGQQLMAINSRSC